MTWVGSPECGRKTLVEASQKTAGQVHAYCRMRNRFHWVIETPQAKLEKAAIAMRPRRETTQTIKPIASRLGLRPSKSASPRPQE